MFVFSRVLESRSNWHVVNRDTFFVTPNARRPLSRELRHVSGLTECVWTYVVLYVVGPRLTGLPLSKRPDVEATEQW